MDPNVLTLLGVCITATSGVIVAIVNTNSKNSAKILAAIDDLKNEIKANSRATVANTRCLISNAYWQYRETKEIPEQVKHNILDLYEAYKGVVIDGHTPNSWCDEIVNEMKTWKTK